MWKLAWRNLWRNRTRTIILLTAVALPYAMMIVSFGFIGDFLRKMEDRAAESAGGTVLVHGNGYWNAKSNDIVIDHPEQVREALAGIDGVEAVIPRVHISGMLTSPHGSVGGRVQGIVKEKQAEIRDWSTHLVRGDFLSGEHARPIVLGAGLVETLDVELGDKVVLTASDLDGEVTRALFRLRGVLKTGSGPTDNALAFTTIEAAQKAIGIGDRLHQIGLLAESGVTSKAIVEVVTAKLGERVDGIEVLTWQEAMPEMVSYLAIVREFGLFSALGLDDWRIGKLVFAETLLLTLVAIAIGLVLGLGGHFAIDHYGIDMAELFGQDMELSGIALTDMVMRSEVVPFKWLMGTVGVVVLIFLAAAYP
ncbi:MAG: ABC transporter permease, partial [Bradymonadaceae bacterium]